MSKETRSMLFAFITLAVLLAGVRASAMKLTLPASMQSIETEAFYGDTSLDEVILPEGVMTIGARAFADSSVTLIHLPETLTFIAGDAFSGCADIRAEVIEGSYAQLICEARNIPYRITRPVTAIELNKTSLKLYFYRDRAEDGTPWSDSTFTLTASVSPADATDPSVTWASSNPSVASVTQDGVVTAVSSGSTIITATTIDGGKTAQCAVTVSDAILRFITQPKDAAVERGKTAVFSVEAALADEFMWQRRARNSGSWSAFSFGTTSGRVNTLSLAGTDENASYQYRCRISDENGFTVFSDPVRITVTNIPVSDVIFDKTSIELSKGSSATLTVSILPADTSDTIIHWSSDNEHVAEISPSQTDSASASVVINAMHQGYATITATAGNGMTATCEVIVVTHYINPSYTAMAVNSTKTMTSSIYPETLYNMGAAWTSSDPELVRVDTPSTNTRYPKVTITALKPGTAVITGTTDVAGAQCTYEVTAVQTILDKQTAALQAGNSFRLIASVSPASYRGTPIDVVWNSSDPAVASVDENGTVTALKVGTTQITATSSAGSAMDACTVTVEPRFKVTKGGGPRVSSLNITTNESWTAATDANWLLLGLTEGTYDKKSVSATGDAKLYVLLDYLPVNLASRTGDIVISYGSYRYTYTFTQKRTDVPMTGVKLSSGTNTDITATLVAGETMTLVPTFVPYYATDRRVTYSSDNAAVATVDANGKITAKAVGSAIITVKTTDGGFTAKCTVTVLAKTISLSKASDTGGVADGGGTTVNAIANAAWTAKSDSAWLTISPANGNSGTTKITIIYAKNTTTAARTGKVTFTCGSTTVVYSLMQNKHTVNLSDGSSSGTTIIRSGVSAEGASYTLTITSNGCAWTAASNVSWLALNTTSGTGNGTLKVTAAKNASTSDRTGIVTVTCGTASATFKVTQYAYLRVTGGTKSTGIVCRNIYVTAAASWTATTTDDWLKLNTIVDSSTATKTISGSATTGSSVVCYVWLTHLPTNLASRTGHVTFKSGTVTYTLDIVQARTDAPATGISVSPKSVSMLVGNTKAITPTFIPSYATDRRLTWTSSNTNVATVSADGVVTAKDGGTATITVKTTDGGFTDTCSITVTVPVTGVTLSPTTLTKGVGKTGTLTATVSPSNATNKAVTWSSSNTNVATVSSSGVVTAKAAGTATITVKTADGGYTATCAVTAIPTWLTELSSSSYARCYTYHPSYGYNVYSDMNLTTVRGEVWASDEVHLLGGAVNGNGTLVAYIDYPIGESYGNKGYIELWLVGGSWSGSSWKASSTQTIYKRSDLSSSIGTMEAGDTVYTLQESDGKRQVMYSLDGGGWKIGWYQISGGQSSTPASYQPMSKGEFMRRVAESAVADYPNSRILPSVITAQAIIETGWGQTEIMMRSNALFGVKATSSWTGGFYSVDTMEYYGEWTTVTALFRAYNNWEECFADHTDILRQSRYAGVIGGTDYVTVCNLLQSGGYATDPYYASKLISIIEANDLTDYDAMVR